MIVSFFCRVAAYFFCVFAYFSSVFANQTEEQMVVQATNIITSSKNALSICYSVEGKLNNCKELNVIYATPDDPIMPYKPLQLRNPIVLALYDNHLYVANYGDVGGAGMGTSSIMKCEIPIMASSNIVCANTLFLASASHITGMSIVGQKLFFVQSFSYQGNSNFNYFVSCDIPVTGRISKCDSSAYMKSLLRNPQQGFNTSMNIIIENDAIYVPDDVGGTVFKCDIPDAENKTKCIPLTKEEATLAHPAGFVVNTQVVNI